MHLLGKVALLRKLQILVILKIIVRVKISNTKVKDFCLNIVFYGFRGGVSMLIGTAIKNQNERKNFRQPLISRPAWPYFMSVSLFEASR